MLTATYLCRINSSAPKGQFTPAQGNALGYYTGMNRALKGQLKADIRMWPFYPSIRAGD